MNSSTTLNEHQLYCVQRLVITVTYFRLEINIMFQGCTSQTNALCLCPAAFSISYMQNRKLVLHDVLLEINLSNRKQ